MFQMGKISKLTEYLLPLSQRPDSRVYFYRIDRTSPDVMAFLQQYYEAARKNGVIIDGRIPNPSTGDLDYFREMLGDAFTLDRNFLSGKLRKWMPRMSPDQNVNVTEAIFSNLQELRASGKNDNILRNVYMKYMCWLYYKFERIAHVLGTQNIPKILYNGSISNHELLFLNVLSRTGADIVLLEPTGDAAYRQLDPQEQYSLLYQAPGSTPLPPDFSLKWIQEEIQKALNRQRLYGPPPGISNCTNAWMEQADMNQVLVESRRRGSDPNLYYNVCLSQYGVEDKLLFPNDLFQFHKQLRSQNRRICVVNQGIPLPTPDEISRIKRGTFSSVEQMIQGLAPNIHCPFGEQLRRVMVKAFTDLMLEAGNAPGISVQKLLNKAVYLLCWLERYQGQLFSGWQMPDVGVFILFGRCATEAEALFLKFLAMLPVDVLVLIPDLNAPCCLKDPPLLELHREQSLMLSQFPTEQAQNRVSTAAYQAERELDTLMYTDSGMYRSQQYAKAETVTLQTMYEEIALLWDQELKYRPSFSVTNDVVSMPVIFDKICGVKNGQPDRYWQDIKALITPDTVVIQQFPWHSSYQGNPMKPFATQFLQNKRLRRDRIKAHKAYPYGILREEMQEHLLDKLQQMLDQKTIRGIYENGTEYTVIATALNLDRDLLRMIQKFDFTRKNPKLLFINTGEQMLSLEDSILIAFLNLVGFDVVFFVPTGYQCVERHFREHSINQHQVGEYLYDLRIPNFQTLKDPKQHHFLNLFRKA